MIPEPASSSRARGTVLGLLAGIVLVLLIRLTVGLSPLVFYGLIGGLVMSLIIVGLDLLHSVERKLGPTKYRPPEDETER